MASKVRRNFAYPVTYAIRGPSITLEMPSPASHRKLPVSAHSPETMPLRRRSLLFVLETRTQIGVEVLEVSMDYAVAKTGQPFFHNGPYKFLPRLPLPGNNCCSSTRSVLNMKQEGGYAEIRDSQIKRIDASNCLELSTPAALGGHTIGSFPRPNSLHP